MRAINQPSGFTGEAARRGFEAAYDRALERLWPVPVDARDVPTRYGTVRLYRAGPHGDDPVVLLSGAGGGALSWHRHVEALARHRPVLAVDPLGEAGRSVPSRPIATGADAGGWLADALDGVGARRAHLVGTSFGGWTALQQQLGHGGGVAALTLVEPAGFGPLTGRFVRWLVLGGLAGLLPAPLRGPAARLLDNPTVTERELIRLGLAGRGFRRRLPTPPVLADADLRAIAVPVQVLLGARSALHDSAAVASRLAATAPTWRVEVVPDAGHALVLDAVALVVDRVLTFSPADEEAPGS